MSKYFPKPYEAFGRNTNVRVDLSNYATKKDIKNITHVKYYAYYAYYTKILRILRTLH